MKRTAFELFFAFVLMGTCLWLTAAAFRADREVVPYFSPDRVESYTVGSFDRLQIRRTYLLPPGESARHIPTADFQEYGAAFHLTELTMEHIDGLDVYTAVFNETAQ